MRLRPFLLLFGILLCAPAWGHPGHGTTDPKSVAHVTEPVHAGPIVAAVIAACAASTVAWKLARKRR